MTAPGFRLRVDVQISQLDEHGREEGRGIEVREQLTLPPMAFLELAAVLGQFHALAEQIKTGRPV